MSIRGEKHPSTGELMEFVLTQYRSHVEDLARLLKSAKKASSMASPEDAFDSKLLDTTEQMHNCTAAMKRGAETIDFVYSALKNKRAQEES